MRGIGAAAAAAAARRHANLPSYAAAFSSFSGIGGSGGAGRGRGRGLPPSASAPPRAPGRPIPEDDEGADPFAAVSSAGRGRGEPAIQSSSTIPPFSSFSGAGRGRGSPLPPPPSGEDAPKQQPTFTKRFDFVPPSSDPEPPTTVASSSSSEPPRSVPTSGAGRGVPRVQQPVDKAPEENRFVRRREAKKAPTPSTPSGQPKLDPQEAVKRALELLGRGGDGGGGRGRGGRGGGRGRGREGGRRPAAVDELEAAYLGDNADGERLEQRLGPEQMELWNATFDEAAAEALPDPEHTAWLDGVHTNNLIEFEPEYHVNFGNPDIEEKPPMSLEEMLEKVKPFIIDYEGIRDQDEWEAAVKDVMKRAPRMKELIDMYSGPDVVSAKQQEDELQRVANTLPQSIPNSVKRFTDKTLLSLKNNPGWGFDKKCQFMDKFVREVSEQYK